MGSASEQKETPQQRALAEHAMNQLADYKKRWLPVQQKLASTIEEMGKPGSEARQLAAGKAATDTAIAFDQAQGKVEKGMSNAGVGPGSSRANLAITGIGTDAAAATGLGHVMTEQQIDDAYTQGLGALTAVGRGERASVGTALTNQARTSAAQAQSDAQISLSNRMNEAGIAGQVAGFGIQQAMGGSFGGGSTFSAYDPNGAGITTGNPIGGLADQGVSKAGLGVGARGY